MEQIEEFKVELVNFHKKLLNVNVNMESIVNDQSVWETEIPYNIHVKRLLGCKCRNYKCKLKSTLDIEGYSIECLGCCSIFPANGKLHNPKEFPILFQERIHSKNTKECKSEPNDGESEQNDGVTELYDSIEEISNIDSISPILINKYVEYIKYKNTENLLDIIKQVILISGSGEKYIYTSNGCWLEWNPTLHRWVNKDTVNMNAEYKIIKSELSRIEKYLLQFGNSEVTESEIEMVQKRKMKTIQRIHKIIEDLGNNITRENVIRMWKSEYTHPTAEQLMNSNNDIIGLKDGVYDLANGVFRKGIQEDFITMTANVSYSQKVDPKKYEFVEQFFNDILPNPEVREYLLKVLSTCLTGNLLQNVFILEGYGKNGKSVLCGFLKELLGMYYEQPRPTIVTRKAESSHEANSAMMKLRGKRILIVPEPSSKEPLQVDKLKAWTGGEKISSRELNKSETDFQPQFKVFIMCNKKPKLSENDGGIKRRLKIIKFPNHFVDTPQLENEKQMDDKILSKLTACTREFFELLTKYYRDYIINGLQEPSDVNELAREYLNDNKDDSLMDFVESGLQLLSEEQIDVWGVLTKNEVKRHFKSTYKKRINIDDFEKEVLERYHIPYKESRRNGEKYRGWVGIQIKSNVM
jgi:P4 family phage/plasmid primase-like protien